jgi:hypothetical protein
MGLWAGNYQEEDPWSYYHLTLDQTIVVEVGEPVIHWVYGAVADVVGSKRPEVKVGIDRILALVHMAGESLAESEVRDKLAAAVAVIADCRRKRQSRLEVVVVEIHQGFGRAQHISYQTIWKESRSLGRWTVLQRKVVRAGYQHGPSTHEAMTHLERPSKLFSSDERMLSSLLGRPPLDRIQIK